MKLQRPPVIILISYIKKQFWITLDSTNDRLLRTHSKVIYARTSLYSFCLFWVVKSRLIPLYPGPVIKKWSVHGPI